MRKNLLPLASLSLLTLNVAACGAMAPQGTTADGISEHNYEMVSLRDGQFEWCEETDIDDALDEQMEKFGLMGCAVGVASGGEVLYLGAQGIMIEDDPDTFMGNDNIPYAIDTLQPIGSVSKPLTAMAILRLQELGHLTVGDSVASHLGLAVAHHPAWVQQASIHELLTHTSGIVDGQVDAEPVFEGAHWTREDVSYEDVDWSSWGYLEDETNGRDPIKAQRILVFPSSTTSTESYSNVGYLLLGAIIESIVTDASFDGFDDYPFVEDDFEPTWEAWVWWVFAGQGELKEANLYSTVVRYPWRQLDDAYPNMAFGYESLYDSSTKTATNTGQISWDQFEDDYGWVAPSGGFMMTIGDLTRLGIQIADEEAIFDNDNYWHVAKTDYSSVRGTWYGYGLYDIGGPVGHGGTIDGYTAGVFVEGDEVIAWQCNTTPRDVDNPDNHVGLHSGVSNAIFDAFDPDTIDVDCVDPIQPDGSVEALDILAVDWYDSEFASLQALAGRMGLERALSYTEKTLQADTDGARALRYLDAGDYEAAAECALSYLGDRSAKWSCGE